MSKKTILLLAVVLLATCFVGGYWWTIKKNAREAYREIPVHRGNLQLSILTTGTVQPENRLEIKAPVAGRMEKVLVVEGQKLRKGQIVAWMSSTERAALLDAARAQGPAEVKRWEDIYRSTPIIAPIDGMLIARNVEPGQTFTNNESILIMSDRLTVKAQVDETDLAQVKLKQKAEIALDAYAENKIPATVEQIAFEAKTVSNITTYIIVVVPATTPEYMRSGMTANVTFFLDEKTNVLLVATEAISIKDGRSQVLVRNHKGQPEERVIQVGATDGKKTEIIEGLAENDIVLMSTSAGRGGKSSSNPFAPSMPGRKRGR